MNATAGRTAARHLLCTPNGVCAWVDYIKSRYKSTNPSLLRRVRPSLVLRSCFFVRPAAFFTGAYGAHGLSGKSDKARADWKTATQYHLCHALAIATLPAYQKTPARAAAGLLFSTGITLFSGSVYYACECVEMCIYVCFATFKNNSLDRRPPPPPAPPRAFAPVLVETVTDLSLALTPFPPTSYFAFCCAALTDDRKASKVAPAGGICLILGWATMALLKR